MDGLKTSLAHGRKMYYVRDEFVTLVDDLTANSRLNFLTELWDPVDIDRTINKSVLRTKNCRNMFV